MWITQVSIRHPVFITMVMTALMVLGIISYQNLGVEENPDVQYPGATVEVFFPGAAPETVEDTITKPIEETINTISGVKTIQSTTSEGRSVSWIHFELSANIDRAMQEMRDRLALLKASFPRDATDPSISRWQENAEPVSAIGVSSATLGLRELSTLTEQIIVKRLQATPGVGMVSVGGSVVRQIRIDLRPERMAAQGVGVDEVLHAIQTSNRDMPAGVITDGATEQLVRIDGRIHDSRAFGKIIVARRPGAAVTLSEVADVSDGEREEKSISRIDGQRGINILVTKTQDANIIAVGEGLKQAVEELRQRLPKDVNVNMRYDKSDSVRREVNNVKKMIVEGAVLTVLIVFFFLHSWRSTVITGLTLPISVVSSFIAIRMFGFTINGMTLMALALSIGLLIDDAIVVRENIVRHLRMGKDSVQAAADGTNEIGLAVMATTFAIVAVFVPVAFMKGIIGRFFLPFGITVSVAVLISLFVSFTLDPMLSSVWHDPNEGRLRRMPGLQRLMDRIEKSVQELHIQYGRILEFSLSHRKSVLTFAALLFAGGLMLLHFTETEFMPHVDSGFITLRFKTPVGASLAYTDAKIRQVEQTLDKVPGIESVLTTVGGDDGDNTALVDVKLTDANLKPRKSQDAIESDIREKLRWIPGIELSVGWFKPVRVELLGQDVEKLDAVAQGIIEKLKVIRGITDLEYSQAAASPAVSIRIDNEAASDLGLTPQQIGTTLRPLLSGNVADYWLAPDGQKYEINVQLPQSGRQKIADLADLMIASGKLGPDGRPIMVPLRQVARFVPSLEPRGIGRQDLQRRVGIYANIQGRSAGDVFADVGALVRNTPLPSGVRFSMPGEAEEMQSMTSSALAALSIAVIFIYLVLASQFGSFLQPLSIMLSLPLSLIGVLLMLMLTSSTLNMFSAIGFIMLMGLVTKNAILLVDFANRAQYDGVSQRDALLMAGKIRLRPILMTTLAMIFGMLPMAIGAGEGGEMQAPMGRAVIGGIITSTLLTLIVTPVAYSYLDTWGRRVVKYFKRDVSGESVRDWKTGAESDFS